MSGAPAKKYKVSFEQDTHAPVELPEGAELSRHLTVQNSPVLFGCRTGICGTCAATVEVLEGTLPEATEEERECVDLVRPGDTKVRLLCQLRLTAAVRIGGIGEGW
jgi:ferredoxin